MLVLEETFTTFSLQLLSYLEVSCSFIFLATAYPIFGTPVILSMDADASLLRPDASLLR